MMRYILLSIQNSLLHIDGQCDVLNPLRFLYRWSWKISEYYLAFQTEIGRDFFWVRHSFYFGNYIPGVSDIDVTVVSSQRPDLFLRRYRQLKRFFPWLGEINWYPREKLLKILTFANPLELSRDPCLIHFAKISPLKPSRAERTVFLIRMLKADLKNLKLGNNYRQKKWSYILEIAGESIPKNTRLSVEILIQIICHPYEGEARKRLKAALDTIENPHPERWLFPQNYFWKDDIFNFQDYFGGFPLECREMTKAQIYWDYWGVNTQLHCLDNDIVKNHLESLWTIFPLISGTNKKNELSYYSLD